METLVPHNGSSDHASLLRSAIARIEGRGGQDAPGCGRRLPVRLGEKLALDRALGGGLGGGTLSEILPASPGDMAAACGFMLALALRLVGFDGPCPRTLIWIIEDFAALEQGAPYGPGLLWLGLAPENLVLVRVPRGQEALWALETALKARGTIVIGELWAQHRLYDLTASRRLALAARASGSPGLILHGRAGGAPASAAATRLEIAGLSSAKEACAAHRLPLSGLPLPGPPAWAVRVAKARAGPQASAHDPERRHLIVWNKAKGCFCDALPVSSSPVSAHRPYRAGHADAGFAKAG